MRPKISRRPRWLDSQLLGIALFALRIFRSHSASVPAPTKLWSIDLGTDNDFQRRLGIEEVLLSPPSIEFLNDAKLICGFYTGAKIGSSEAQGGNGYDVLGIYTQNGALGRRLRFSAWENDYRILPVVDNSFVVLAGDELKKFNSEFDASAVIPAARVEGEKQFDRRETDVSPTGKTVLLYSHQPGDDQAEWRWLRSEDLSVIRSIHAPVATGTGIKTADDEAIRGAAFDQILFDRDGERTVCARCAVHFITDDLLFLDYGHSYSIETTKGQEQHSGELNVEALHFTRSSRASRIAFLTGHYIQGNSSNPDSIAGRIMVLDWKKKKQVTEISWTEPVHDPSAGLNQMALALSPDGKYLAVLLHQTLSFYRLPEVG